MTSKKKEHLKIAACQIADIQSDVLRASSKMKELALQAQLQEADLILFPECYLQGYTVDKIEARHRSLDLSSSEFKDILRSLASLEITLVFGLIEQSNGSLFNTAVVIRRGSLLGSYRKTHPHEGIFEAGTTFSVFEIGGWKFGINICYDANFPNAAEALKNQGADLICYPLNNLLPPLTAEKWRSRHLENLIARALQTGAWIVSSDVVGERDGNIGYGCTAIVSPKGTVKARVTELEEGMVIYEISRSAKSGSATSKTPELFS